MIVLLDERSILVFYFYNITHLRNYVPRVLLYNIYIRIHMYKNKYKINSFKRKHKLETYLKNKYDPIKTIFLKITTVIYHL